MKEFRFWVTHALERGTKNERLTRVPVMRGTDSHMWSTVREKRERNLGNSFIIKRDGICIPETSKKLAVKTRQRIMRKNDERLTDPGTSCIRKLAGNGLKKKVINQGNSHQKIMRESDERLTSPGTSCKRKLVGEG